MTTADTTVQIRGASAAMDDPADRRMMERKIRRAAVQMMRLRTRQGERPYDRASLQRHIIDTPAHIRERIISHMRSLSFEARRLSIRPDRNRRRGRPTSVTVSRIARLLVHCHRSPDAALLRRANVVLGRWAR